MARIRTIKPEFWTDEKIVKLPFVARLLFIGMWNFADDSGAIDYSPDRLKLQVLPSEADCDITGLIDLLEAAGLISYWVSEEGTSAITINGWAKHQKIDNPSRKTIIREDYRKKAILTEDRIGVAKKYGCPPGGEVEASCYYCGMPGTVKWWKDQNGKPTRWITLSDLEFDHFVSEHAGGNSSKGNLVLACRCCNRGKREFDPHQFFAIKNPSIVLDRSREEPPLDQGSRIKDQGMDQGEDQGPGRDQVPTPLRVAKKSATAPETAEVWNSYSTAYQARYGAEPVRNRKVNGQLASLLKRLGKDEAPGVAAWYVASNNRYYVQKRHAVDCLLSDAEGLRTEWATNRRVTETQAREADRLQTTGDMWTRIAEEECANGRH